MTGLGWWYAVVEDLGPVKGRVLLRGRGETLQHFGLDALPEVETSYERGGGIHIGKLRVSPYRVSWQAFKIAVPQRYPSGRGWVGWTICLSRNHRVRDFVTLAMVIEASGAAWTGFLKGTGGRYLERECLLGTAGLSQTS
jgi:hypothetical protein